MVTSFSETRRLLIRSAALLAWMVLATGVNAQPSVGGDQATGKAIAFLARNVAAWPRDNHCFSCHNNGDAARVLYVAKQHRFPVPDDSLRTTTTWLNNPSAWHAGTEDAEFKDKELATIQFASALVAATEAEAILPNAALAAAAQQVATFQDADGGWSVQRSRLGGSPIAYSDLLATAMSRNVLARADARRFADQISAADQRLRTANAYAMADLAGILIGLDDATDDPACRQRQRCLQRIIKAQDASGGWGPFADYRPETFDTAIVLLALSSNRGQKGVADMIARGRQVLIDTQWKDGSWLETTRPAGAESYAHRVSTTAWAALALVVTEKKHGQLPRGKYR